jgi:hypothetical protein
MEEENEGKEQTGGQPESRITELERLVTQKGAELEAAGARIKELEQTLTGKEGEIGRLSQAKQDIEKNLEAANSALTTAVASYKDMVIGANPDVVPELVTGQTIEAVNESLSKAKALVNKVKQGLEAENQLSRMPAGAPERRAADLSGLSAREKIRYAIGGKN